MIKLFCNIYKIPLCLLILVNTWNNSHAGNNSDRAGQIRQMMWNNTDAAFENTTVPDKWSDRSAVILARENILSYRKEVLLAQLNYHNMEHVRIKILDQMALAELSQFSFPESGSIGNKKSSYYAGFKVIKPDGKEILVSMDQAVKEERVLNNQGFNLIKLAIPNLEVGDILDYYLAEEQTIQLYASYYSFDPVIFQLNGDYPTLKHKISFDVLRRCYINVKSVNGAPEFILDEDARKDKNHYSLEVSHMESARDIRWLYPNRALPTVKFKITYASALSASMASFLGEQGVIKNQVSRQEVKQFLTILFSVRTTEFADLKKYMKRKYKKVKDQDFLAREAYYFLRNQYRVKYAEALTVIGKNPDPHTSMYSLVATLSNYLRWAKINHDVIIGLPREVSALEDLIMEDELDFMLKINTDDPFYIGRFSNHAAVGEINESFQGTEVYVANGLLPPGLWNLRTCGIPVVPAHLNKSVTNSTVDLSIEQSQVNVALNRALTGSLKLDYQQLLMDFYDYRDEEAERFEPEPSFSQYAPEEKIILVKQKDDYLAHRAETKQELLKFLLSNEYGFTIDQVSNFHILQTGRFHQQNAFKIACAFSFKEGIKKAGPNLLFSVGKLIEAQTKLDQEELTRNHDIFLNSSRTFHHQIEIDLPPGYTAVGLEKLYYDVRNETGAFVSHAYQEGHKIVVQLKKTYHGNFVDKAKWPEMVTFLQAAQAFSKQEVLLKKGAVNDDDGHTYYFIE